LIEQYEPRLVALGRGVFYKKAEAEEAGGRDFLGVGTAEWDGADPLLNERPILKI
jgi:hypothetical protein